MSKPTTIDVTASLPVFVTQKTVRAARIVDFQDDPGSTLMGIEVEGARRYIDVDQAWLRKHNPQVGWWFIVYPDGYRSASPEAVFLESATPEAEYGLPLRQEPKYTVGPRGRLINRETGAAIPDEEPIFILRAKDTNAAPTVARYMTALPEGSPIWERVAARLSAFNAFARVFATLMRKPT